MGNFINYVRRITLIFSTLLAVSACNSYEQKSGGTVNKADTSLPDFATIQSDILQPYCVSCHGAGGSPDLSTYASVKANASQIYSAVVVNQSMPMGQTLPPALVQMLANWINDGTPQVVARSYDQVPDQRSGVTPTFSSIETTILQPNCGACHGPSSNYPIGDYALLIKTKWVVPGNPQTSELYQAISAKRMPPGNPLAANDLNIIDTWIAAGAPNN